MLRGKAHTSSTTKMRFTSTGSLSCISCIWASRIPRTSFANGKVDLNPEIESSSLALTHQDFARTHPPTKPTRPVGKHLRDLPAQKIAGGHPMAIKPGNGKSPTFTRWSYCSTGSVFQCQRLQKPSVMAMFLGKWAIHSNPLAIGENSPCSDYPASISPGSGSRDSINDSKSGFTRRTRPGVPPQNSQKGALASELKYIRKISLDLGWNDPLVV